MAGWAHESLCSLSCHSFPVISLIKAQIAAVVILPAANRMIDTQRFLEQITPQQSEAHRWISNNHNTEMCPTMTHTVSAGGQRLCLPIALNDAMWICKAAVVLTRLLAPTPSQFGKCVCRIIKQIENTIHFHLPKDLPPHNCVAGSHMCLASPNTEHICPRAPHWISGATLLSGRSCVFLLCQQRMLFTEVPCFHLNLLK